MKQKLINFFLNTLYFTFVFVITFAIASLALVRKVNSYEATREPFFVSIHKEQFELTSPVAGRLDSVSVVTGQHVNAGEVIAQLSDESLERKLAVLEQVADKNLSASTEAEVLRAQKEQLTIKAPSNGVVYKVHGSAGNFLGQGAPVVTLFGDAHVTLVGYVNPIQYSEIQQLHELDVYSTRFQQIYKIKLEGVGKVDASTDKNRYEVIFQFIDEDEGPAFLEGETLEVVSSQSKDTAQRPVQYLVEMWNTFIIGK